MMKSSPALTDGTSPNDPTSAAPASLSKFRIGQNRENSSGSRWFVLDRRDRESLTRRYLRTSWDRLAR
ncbi:hypothetical protein PGTUg99_019692 [Puccinia graminis f. sp. tritici]|uniref:Uncharacterized protein n=1 Tax=Puccinia graminis f. sp. tritici TaxID=56615 RepID=A0A5B0S3N4_PUCGR|nr:hypothetical protein PGTUg99_019692 [Puccinia graminis f. sp. tritici]